MKNRQVVVFERIGGNEQKVLHRWNTASKMVSFGRGGSSDVVFGQENSNISRKQLELYSKKGKVLLRNVGKNPVLTADGKLHIDPGASLEIRNSLELVFSTNRLKFDIDSTVPSFRLVGKLQDGASVKFSLQPSQKYVVGRDPASSLCIPSAGVSKKHCELTVMAGGTVRIKDLGSRNKVSRFVDGSVQPPENEFEIALGETFYLGDVSAVIKKGSPIGKKHLYLAGAGLVVAVILLIFGPGKSMPERVIDLDGGKDSLDRVIEIIQADDLAFEEKSQSLNVLSSTFSFNPSYRGLTDQLQEYFDCLSEMDGLLPKQEKIFCDTKKASKKRVMAWDFMGLAVMPYDDLENRYLGIRNLQTNIVATAGSVSVAFKGHHKQSKDLLDHTVGLLDEIKDYNENISVPRALGVNFIRNVEGFSGNYGKKLRASIKQLFPDFPEKRLQDIPDTLETVSMLKTAQNDLVQALEKTWKNYREYNKRIEPIPSRTIKKIEQNIPAIEPLVFGRLENYHGLEDTQLLLDYCTEISRGWTEIELLAATKHLQDKMSGSKSGLRKNSSLLDLMQTMQEDLLEFEREYVSELKVQYDKLYFNLDIDTIKYEEAKSFSLLYSETMRLTEFDGFESMLPENYRTLRSMQDDILDNIVDTLEGWYAAAKNSSDVSKKKEKKYAEQVFEVLKLIKRRGIHDQRLEKKLKKLENWAGEPRDSFLRG